MSIEDEKLKDLYLRDSVKLRETGKFDEAIDLLQTAVAKFPQSVTIISALSHCYLLNNNIADASFYLDKVKKIDPENISLQWNTARVLLLKGQFKEALTLAKATNSKYPDDIEGMGVLGSCLRLNNYTEEGLILLNRAISINPSYAEAYLNRGLIRLAINKKESALEDLEKTFSLKPHLKVIWDTIISLKIENKQFIETISFLKELLKLEPNNEKILVIQGQCYKQLSQFDFAIESYKKAIEINGNYAEAYGNLGLVLSMINELDDAIVNFKYALSLDPVESAIHYSLGNAEQKKGDYVSAINSYKKAIDINPEYIEAHNNLGEAFTKLDDWTAALKSFAQAVSINFEYAEAHFNLGNAQKELGLFKDSKSSLQQAIALNPKFAEAHHILSELFYIEGDLKAAIQSIEKAVEIKPKSKVFRLFFNFLTVSKTKTISNVREHENVPSGSQITLLNREVEKELTDYLYSTQLLDLNKESDPSFGHTRGSGYDLFEDDHQVIKKLELSLRDIIMNAFDADVFIYDAFLSIFGAGGGTGRHNHINKKDLDRELNLAQHKFSLVYYLEVGNQDCDQPGYLEFHNPSEKILPKRGLITIFPADRYHSSIYGGDKDRVIVGLNFYIF